MPDSTVVISSLPSDTFAVPPAPEIPSAERTAVADSAVPAVFAADSLPALPAEPAFCLDSVLRGGVTDLPSGRPEIPWADPQPFTFRETAGYSLEGVAGDPLPYRFRSDDFVTSALMISFFLMVWTIARGWYFLMMSMKDFFRDRVRDNLFAERTDTEMSGRIFLIFQTCFLLGILFFDYTQECMTEVFNNVSPYLILGVGVGSCCLYYLLKVLLYTCVNHVFFDREQASRWTEAYLFSVFVLGMALLPLVLLVVYFDLSFGNLRVLFILILGMVKILLFYKCFRVFFKYLTGGLHLILYFCALEILPLLVLWRALIYANNNLTVI